MAAALAQPSIQTIFDEVGRFIPGAKVYYYLAGTTTPLTVYTTADLDVAHARPVLANAAGRFPPIYVGDVTYKARIMDSSGSLLEEIDGIQGAVPVPVDPGDIVPGTLIPTGRLSAGYGTEPETGWVRANGRTIGSGASGANELADATAEDLFLHLWSVDAALAVSGGRGGSAAADWAANKTLTLPSFRGRSMIGLDSMGNTAAGVITTATFANPNLLGSVGGAEKVSLSIDNIDSFTLTGSTTGAGAHDHIGGVSNAIGNHDHSYQDDSATNSAIITIGGGAGVLVTVPPLTGAGRTTGTNGYHQHEITLPSSGTHTHPVTINAAGGGTDHSNIQPSVLVTVYIKL